MVRTRVGYAGGAEKNPTYYNLGGHSESVQVDYDPSVISYEELQAVFWEDHDPLWQSGTRQYRNILFYHNDEQKKVAEETRDRLEKKLGSKVATDILPYTGFSLAEDYHQKHSLRMYNDIMEELTAIYPSVRDLISSTAAARVNGYLGGFGTCEDLKKEIKDLGLSPRGQKKLLDIVC